MTSVETQSQMGAALQEWRDHWRIGLAATLGIGLGTSISATVFSLFIAPLQHEFGWTRTAIGTAYSMSLVAAIAGPFAGRLIDRIGVRTPLLVGTLIAALTYLGMALMNGSLVLFYVLFAAVNLFGLASTGLSYSRAISEVFVRSRGVSLAIARSGLSISNAIMPTIVFAVIAAAGWRGGYVFLAAIMALISLPLAYAWIRPRCTGDIRRSAGRHCTAMARPGP